MHKGVVWWKLHSSKCFYTALLWWDFLHLYGCRYMPTFTNIRWYVVVLSHSVVGRCWNSAPPTSLSFAVDFGGDDALARIKKLDRGVSNWTALATWLNVSWHCVTHSQIYHHESRLYRRAREKGEEQLSDTDEEKTHQDGIAYRIATLPEHQRRLLRRMNTLHSPTTSLQLRRSWF